MKTIYKKKCDQVWICAEADRIWLNCLRRCLMRSVPAHALRDITIIKNTSAFNNEMIEQRISLIPIMGQCTLQLDVMNYDSKNMYVTSSHFQFESGQAKFIPEIIICELRPGEEIQCVAKTSVGTPMDHIAYRSVSNTFFRQMPIVNIKKHKQKILDYFDRCGILYYPFGNKFTSEMIRTLDCSQVCEHLQIPGNSYTVETDEATYLFVVHSYLKDPQDLLDKANAILHEQIKNVLQLQPEFELKECTYGIKFSKSDVDCSILAWISSQMEKRFPHQIRFANYESKHPHDQFYWLHVTMVHPNIYDLKQMFREICNTNSL